MSVRMIASRAILRAAVRPRLERASLEALRKADLRDPPPAVADAHAWEAEHRGDARLVWLEPLARSLPGRRAGGRLLEQRGGFHGYPMSASFLPEARWAIERQAEFIRRHR
jgi:hypothetical protein